MRKLFALFLASLLPISLLAGTGDVNGDGKVNVADIVEIVNYLGGKPSEIFLAAEADCNNDGKVDQSDVDAMADMILTGYDFNMTYDEDKVRSALMDLYYATDGDHWKNNTNWGSDKPISEWYGLDFTYDGRFWGINLYDNNLSGTLPSSLKNLTSIYHLYLNSNNLTGTIPQELSMMSNLHVIDLSRNNLSGEFPQKPFETWMNRAGTRANFNFFENNFSGPIPEWVQKHRLFSEFWPEFCCQKDINLRAITDTTYIPGPYYKLTDINKEVHESSKDYSNNKLVVLYRWATWCPYSQSFTPILSSAYNKYKDAGLKVIGLDDFGSIPADTQEELEAYCVEHNVTWPNVSLFYSNDERNNSVWPMTLTTETPLIFAVNNKGELVFHSFGGCYNDFISLVEEYFGPIDKEDYYTSSDYSHDGEVLILQTATEGNGVDIVFVGEAFTDKDIASGGKYEQKMKAAMTQFFSYEPYKSLRNRFNVYAVNAVSPNEEFAEDAKHAIEENDETAFKYALKAVGDNPERLLVGVIYNTETTLDRSYCSMYSDGSCVAYLMDGINEVLNHELGGHGIAQLMDEYIEPGNELLELPDTKKAELDELWPTGAAVNVDYHSAASDIKWAHILNNPLYSDEVGIYEGSFLYGKGAYRPSENSMMRYNDCDFNAPSRESIYKHVMQYSEGDSWTYDFETFVAFDAPAREAIKAARGKARDAETRRRRIETRPPTINKGIWRDARQ